MKVLLRLLVVAFAVALVACNSDSGSSSEDSSDNGSGNGSGGGGGGTASAGDLDANWAATVVSANRETLFDAVAVAADGSVYAVGAQEGRAEVDYGSGVTAEGASNSLNAVIVKYNSDGEAQWASTTEEAPRGSRFHAVAVDDDGNVFAAGYQSRTGEFDYGNGVTAQSGANGEFPGNLVVVKYNADGEAQWARTVSDRDGSEFSSETSVYHSIAVDSEGNVYAAGYIGVGDFTVSEAGAADEVTVSGRGDPPAVLVKYDTDGTAQWATSITSDSTPSGCMARSEFYDVAVDDNDDVYVVGFQRCSGQYSYGNGVSVEGGGASLSNNSSLIKYNSDGEAQWARSVEEGSGRSEFKGVAVDGDGNIIAVGYQRGDGEFQYGDSVTAAGSVDGALSAVAVYYDSDGNAQWAQATETTLEDSEFLSVAVNASGDIFAAGYIGDDNTFDFGNDVSVEGSADDNNAVIVSFNSDGEAQAASTVTGVSFESQFNGVAVGDNVYAVGYQSGNEEFEYGDDVAPSGASGIDNAVIVQY